ncbi:MAG: hypothetical protein ACREUE_06475 [Panacagrimonas sp.]
MDYAIGTHQHPSHARWCWFVVFVDVATGTIGRFEQSDYKFLTMERAEADGKRQMRMRSAVSIESPPA